ncbi:MAG: hypothetical protein ACT4OT_17100 [Acidobacteriota bacterium]
MDTPVCDICGTIPELPPQTCVKARDWPNGVADLVDAYPSPAAFRDTSKDYEITKKCPHCRQLFTYHYYCEFSVGYVEESVWIERQKK